MTRDRTAVLLVRVWMDGHDPSTLRARITHRRGVGATDETEVLVASIDDIEATVHGWLEAFTTHSD
jgi:hypothetical protein